MSIWNSYALLLFQSASCTFISRKHGQIALAKYKAYRNIIDCAFYLPVNTIVWWEYLIQDEGLSVLHLKMAKNLILKWEGFLLCSGLRTSNKNQKEKTHWTAQVNKKAITYHSWRSPVPYTDGTVPYTGGTVYGTVPYTTVWGKSDGLWSKVLMKKWFLLIKLNRGLNHLSGHWTVIWKIRPKA